MSSHSGLRRRLVLGGSATLLSAPLAAAQRALTPSQMLGPFYPVTPPLHQDNDLTRDCILKGAQEVTEWTGGGLHAPTSPATNEGAECFVVLQVKDGEFTRWTPTDEDFACDPDFVATVEPAS